MEATFSFVETYFEQQMQWHNIVFMITGCLMILIATLLFVAHIYQLVFGEVVSLHVIANHIETKEKQEDDGIITTKTLYRPEFKILNGLQTGQTLLSSSASSEQLHDIGESTTGYISKYLDGVISHSQLKQGFNISAIIMGVGIVCIIIALYMPSSL